MKYVLNSLAPFTTMTSAAAPPQNTASPGSASIARRRASSDATASDPIPPPSHRGSVFMRSQIAVEAESLRDIEPVEVQHCDSRIGKQVESPQPENRQE